ncbi:hypothetical protein K4X33_13810 [Brevibacterium casei]|nr:hypothetical protein K4X33_13810 [Brevibacterium casei]
MRIAPRSPVLVEVAPESVGGEESTGGEEPAGGVADADRPADGVGASAA